MLFYDGYIPNCICYYICVSSGPWYMSVLYYYIPFLTSLLAVNNVKSCHFVDHKGFICIIKQEKEINNIFVIGHCKWGHASVTTACAEHLLRGDRCFWVEASSKHTFHQDAAIRADMIMTDCFSKSKSHRWKCH